MTQLERYPVDVICMCAADGEIRPLRLRMEDEDHEPLRMDILEIVGVKHIPYVGAEANLFICRGKVGQREWMVELRYAIRSHTWSLLRRIY